MLRPDMNIRLDEFVVMPNHFHGIILIGRNENKDRVSSVSRFGPQSNNLSSIVRGVKASVTSHAKRQGIVFQWQSRFYDHIIRDDDDFDRIRAYIVNNPLNWDKDEYNL